MAKVQTLKRIIQEDFEQKDRPLVNKIGASINLFADDTINAFNNNLSIEDNFNWSRKTITVTVNGSGVPTSTLQFKSGLKSACKGLQVIKATNLTSSTTYPTGTPFISFTENNRVITVNNISNLQSNNNYSLNIIIYP